MDEQARFEAWAIERGWNPVRSSNGHYMEIGSSIAWQAWQAASAGRQELVEALRGLLNTWNAVCDVKGWDRDHTVAAELARAALAKHGEQQ
jgi:hypothetical protein